MRCRLVASLALCASFGLSTADLAHAEAPLPGAKAPDFSLVGSDGETYTLSDFVGKTGVVLAWFPKAFTAG